MYLQFFPVNLNLVDWKLSVAEAYAVCRIKESVDSSLLIGQSIFIFFPLRELPVRVLVWNWA